MPSSPLLGAAGTQQPRSADFSLLPLDVPLQLQISWGHLALPDVVRCALLAPPKEAGSPAGRAGRVSASRTSPCLPEGPQALTRQACDLLAKSCQALCDPMDHRLPGSSVHGFSQARILEWVAISFAMGSSRPRGRTCDSCRWSPASQADSSPLSQRGTAQMILQGATPPCPGPSECCVSFSRHEPVPGKVVITWLPRSWPLEGVWVSYSPLRPQHLGPYQMLNTRAERTH